MVLSTLDLALRAGTTALLLVLAASLFRDFRGAVAGRLAVAFALGSAAHAVTYGIGATTPVSVWHAPLIALSTANIVVFWLFTRALFDDAFKMRWWHALSWSRCAAACGFLSSAPQRCTAASMPSCRYWYRAARLPMSPTPRMPACW